MQTVVIFGALTALCFVYLPTTRGQHAEEIERLRRENERLKKEIDLLKKETATGDSTYRYHFQREHFRAGRCDQTN